MFLGGGGAREQNNGDRSFLAPHDLTPFVRSPRDSLDIMAEVLLARRPAAGNNSNPTGTGGASSSAGSSSASSLSMSSSLGRPPPRVGGATNTSRNGGSSNGLLPRSGPSVLPHSTPQITTASGGGTRLNDEYGRRDATAKSTNMSGSGGGSSSGRMTMPLPPPQSGGGSSVRHPRRGSSASSSVSTRNSGHQLSGGAAGKRNDYKPRRSSHSEFRHAALRRSGLNLFDDSSCSSSSSDDDDGEEDGAGNMYDVVQEGGGDHHGEMAAYDYDAYDEEPRGGEYGNSNGNGSNSGVGGGSLDGGGDKDGTQADASAPLVVVEEDKVDGSSKVMRVKPGSLAATPLVDEEALRKKMRRRQKRQRMKQQHQQKEMERLHWRREEAEEGKKGDDNDGEGGGGATTAAIDGGNGVAIAATPAEESSILTEGWEGTTTIVSSASMSSTETSRTRRYPNGGNSCGGGGGGGVPGVEEEVDGFDEEEMAEALVEPTPSLSLVVSMDDGTGYHGHSPPPRRNAIAVDPMSSPMMSPAADLLFPPTTGSALGRPPPHSIRSRSEGLGPHGPRLPPPGGAVAPPSPSARRRQVSVGASPYRLHQASSSSNHLHGMYSPAGGRRHSMAYTGAGGYNNGHQHNLRYSGSSGASSFGGAVGMLDTLPSYSMSHGIRSRGRDSFLVAAGMRSDTEGDLAAAPGMGGKRKSSKKRLRPIGEVVPDFSELHSHLGCHFLRKSVPPETLLMESDYLAYVRHMTKALEDEEEDEEEEDDDNCDTTASSSWAPVSDTQKVLESIGQQAQKHVDMFQERIGAELTHRAESQCNLCRSVNAHPIIEMTVSHKIKAPPVPSTSSSSSATAAGASGSSSLAVARKMTVAGEAAAGRRKAIEDGGRNGEGGAPEHNVDLTKGRGMGAIDESEKGDSSWDGSGPGLDTEGQRQGDNNSNKGGSGRRQLLLGQDMDSNDGRTMDLNTMAIGTVESFRMHGSEAQIQMLLPELRSSSLTGVDLTNLGDEEGATIPAQDEGGGLGEVVEDNFPVLSSLVSRAASRQMPRKTRSKVGGRKGAGSLLSTAGEEGGQEEESDTRENEKDAGVDTPPNAALDIKGDVAASDEGTRSPTSLSGKSLITSQYHPRKEHKVAHFDMMKSSMPSVVTVDPQESDGARFFGDAFDREESGPDLIQRRAAVDSDGGGQPPMGVGTVVNTALTMFCNAQDIHRSGVVFEDEDEQAELAAASAGPALEDGLDRGSFSGRPSPTASLIASHDATYSGNLRSSFAVTPMAPVPPTGTVSGDDVSDMLLASTGSMSSRGTGTSCPGAVLLDSEQSLKAGSTPHVGTSTGPPSPPFAPLAVSSTAVQLALQRAGDANDCSLVGDDFQPTQNGGSHSAGGSSSVFAPSPPLSSAGHEMMVSKVKKPVAIRRSETPLRQPGAGMARPGGAVQSRSASTSVLWAEEKDDIRESSAPCDTSAECTGQSGTTEKHASGGDAKSPSFRSLHSFWDQKKALSPGSSKSETIGALPGVHSKAATYSCRNGSTSLSGSGRSVATTAATTDVGSVEGYNCSRKNTVGSEGSLSTLTVSPSPNAFYKVIAVKATNVIGETGLYEVKHSLSWPRDMGFPPVRPTLNGTSSWCEEAESSVHSLRLLTSETKSQGLNKATQPMHAFAPSAVESIQAAHRDDVLFDERSPGERQESSERSPPRKSGIGCGNSKGSSLAVPTTPTFASVWIMDGESQAGGQSSSEMSTAKGVLEITMDDEERPLEPHVSEHCTPLRGFSSRNVTAAVGQQDLSHGQAAQALDTTPIKRRSMQRNRSMSLTDSPTAALRTYITQPVTPALQLSRVESSHSNASGARKLASTTGAQDGATEEDGGPEGEQETPPPDLPIQRLLLIPMIGNVIAGDDDDLAFLDNYMYSSSNHFAPVENPFSPGGSVGGERASLNSDDGRNASTWSVVGAPSAEEQDVREVSFSSKHMIEDYGSVVSRGSGGRRTGILPPLGTVVPEYSYPSEWEETPSQSGPYAHGDPAFCAGIISRDGVEEVFCSNGEVLSSCNFGISFGTTMGHVFNGEKEDTSAREDGINGGVRDDTMASLDPDAFPETPFPAGGNSTSKARKSITKSIKRAFSAGWVGVQDMGSAFQVGQCGPLDIGGYVGRRKNRCRVGGHEFTPPTLKRHDRVRDDDDLRIHRDPDANEAE